MPNRYLTDNFAPVHTELTAFDLPVTGHLPEHLDGRYLRNGPNPAADPGPQHHWFLGQGMVHGVRMSGGAPSGTATGGSSRRGRTTDRTPTWCSTPARRWRSSRPGPRPTS